MIYYYCLLNVMRVGFPNFTVHFSIDRMCYKLSMKIPKLCHFTEINMYFLLLNHVQFFEEDTRMSYPTI